MHWNGLKKLPKEYIYVYIYMIQKQYISVRKYIFLTENEKKGAGVMT